MSGDHTKAHQKLVDDILFAIGSRADVRLWPRHVGAARGFDDDEFIIKYGIKGETDLDGVVAPWGLRLAIEVKTGAGVLNDDQEKWERMITKFGAIHIVARSVDQAVEDLEKGIALWKRKTFAALTAELT
ncbi:hypothetical protein phi1422_0018 [Bdellovibrio phage phi1422]|uniref:endonuclease n=1 Tax=Bdellovibrio phage phi1422 TaxID=1127515 RepID=UPI0002536D11|nr:endonuclease [Bdellovibrio phage phi1422]AFC22538.1 hypothetical protein phi1422_0018 [Bdellovibrio phage phi1422]